MQTDFFLTKSQKLSVIMDELGRQIVKYGKQKQFDKLMKLITESSTKSLINEACRGITSPDGYNLWNYILMCFDTDDIAKMFQITMAVLNAMNAIEVAQNRCYDIVIRLYNELPKFNAFHLIELVEFCMDSMRLGDPKCIGWKDLLPEVIILLTPMPSIMVNGFQMTGPEYREQCVKNLCTMKWPTTVLTPLTMMLKDMPITSDEKTKLLYKIFENLNDLRPEELPPLAYQLFRLCDSAGMFVMPIFCFHMYFHRHYYKDLFADMDSNITNYDSIDQYSSKSLLEAQETILYHLDKATDHFISEKNIVNYCRPLSSTPRYILSPFFLSALLTMCNINRYPESTRLSSSHLLPLLRQVIQNNELEKEMCLQSAWCRETVDQCTVSIEKLLEVLIDQSKDGKDVVTPGIAGLAFVLLKSSTPSLHAIASHLLEKFVKKRFIFGPGIIKHVTDFMLADQESQQYDDCLTRLSRTNTYTFTECLDTIERILEYFLLIPGHYAMRMMTCIMTLIKSSLRIRDMFIEMLRKAMNKREVETRHLGVYGFCVVLNNLRESNAAVRASSASGLLNSQFSLSGYSVMSQSMMLGTAVDTPARNFDILALEILGVLRNCLTGPVDIKQILYDGLSKAIDCNPKLTPHIVLFLEWHFISFFTVDHVQCEIHLKNVLQNTDENSDNFVVYDDLGKLMQLMGRCVYACQKNGLICDTTSVESLLDTLMKRITGIGLEQYGLVGQLDQRTSVIGCQYLNCLEALMSYAIWTTNTENNRIQSILKLHNHHTETAEQLKVANMSKKNKKAKKIDITQASNGTQSDQTTTIVHQPENMWDLVTLERFFHVMHDDMVPFANSNQTAPIRSNNEFHRGLLRTAISRIQGLITLPEYLQIRYSQSTFQHLIQVSRIIYEKCLKQLAALSSRFDLISVQLSAQCFYQCLTVTSTLYKRKFNVFLQGITNQPTGSIGANSAIVIEVLQLLLEQFITDEISDEEGKVPKLLLQCLEIIYEYVPIEGTSLVEHYNWLYQFCLKNDLDAHNMSLIHKLLFYLRIRTHPDGFFDTIAIQIGDILGQIDEEPTEGRFKLASLTNKTVDSCILYMCACLKKQIEEAEYFITKAKSFHVKMKIAGLAKSQNCIKSMKNTERHLCSQLVTIAMAVIPLCNTSLPSGQCADSVVRVLIQYYICLTNLTKHLTLRQATVHVSCHDIYFDKLVRRIGRTLPLKVYRLIEHIEQTLPPEQRNRKPKAATKSLRDTKLLPKLVFRMENFYKFVVVLGKKTKTDLAKQLHIGSVRDFKISSRGLKDAMDRSIAESQRIEVDETQLGEAEIADLDEVELSEAESLPEEEETEQTNSTSSGELVAKVTERTENESDPQVALRNLAKINARASRKRAQPPVEETLGIRTFQVTPEVVPKKKRARNPRKIIKKSTEKEGESKSTRRKGN